MRAAAIDTGELTPSVCEEMRLLLRSCFDGTTPAQFEADLSTKDRAILVRDAHGSLVGFTTYARYTYADAHEIVCSGDTIVAPSAWGSHHLHRAWIRDLLNSTPPSELPLYWLLITSGFRTYRFLPVFFKAFLPDHRRAPDAAELELKHALATHRWGVDYDEQMGVVRLRQPQRLIPSLAAVPPGRQRDPHVAHFLGLNPGHVDGDELVCLTRVERDNLTAAGLRMLGEQAIAAASASPVP